MSEGELRNLKRVMVAAAGNVVRGQLDSDAVQDIVQNAYMALLRNPFNPLAGTKLTTYATIVARTHAIDALRVNGRIREVPSLFDDDEFPVEWCSSEPDALSKLVAHERAALVRQVSKRLAGPDRALLTAMQKDSFDIIEYAHANGMPPNAVYIRKCRLVKRLKALLADLK